MDKIKNKPGFPLSASGLAVLLCVFVLWWKNSSFGLPGRLAAIASAALFAGVCLRFVPVWLDFWTGDGISPSGAEAPPDGEKRILWQLALAFLGFAAASHGLVFLIRTLAGQQQGLAGAMDFWNCADAQHYLDIARDWYLSEGSIHRLVQLVFLPGYPLLVRFFSLFSANTLLSGLAASWLCFSAAGPVLYKLLRLDMPRPQALRTVKFLGLLPGAFFFAAPMSESLFLLLCLLCLYLARTGKWAAGCLAGGLAAFTRSLGLTLAVPLFFELMRFAKTGEGAKERWKKAVFKAACLLAVPAGFAAYCWINYRVSGNPFQYLIYQKEHWGQSLGWFFNTAAYQTELVISKAGEGDIPLLLGLWLPNVLCGFGALAVMLAAVKKLRASYGAWFLAYYVIAIGATWLLSAPRYMTVLLPVPMALGILGEDRWTDGFLTAALGCFSLFYTCAFALRWQVW